MVLRSLLSYNICLGASMICSMINYFELKCIEWNNIIINQNCFYVFFFLVLEFENCVSLMYSFLWSTTRAFVFVCYTSQHRIFTTGYFRYSKHSHIHDQWTVVKLSDGTLAQKNYMTSKLNRFSSKTKFTKHMLI